MIGKLGEGNFASVFKGLVRFALRDALDIEKWGRGNQEARD
jgi:hypothetical protein